MVLAIDYSHWYTTCVAQKCLEQSSKKDCLMKLKVEDTEDRTKEKK